jgi:hypothetical protein
MPARAQAIIHEILMHLLSELTGLDIFRKFTLNQRPLRASCSAMAIGKASISMKPNERISFALSTEKLDTLAYSFAKERNDLTLPFLYFSFNKSFQKNIFNILA